MKVLTLLHLSDLHSRATEIAEFRLRRDALFKDLRRLRLTPQVVLVSGDIAFSGDASQYEIAQGEFFSPLLDELRIDKNSLVISPGNHDIARNLIDDLVRDGVSTRLSDTDTAQSLLAHKA